MEPEEKKHTPKFTTVFLKQLGMSCLIFVIITPLCILLLYMWANSLGTCVKRPSFTLLSMLEELAPMVTYPIQRLVCPQ